MNRELNQHSTKSTLGMSVQWLLRLGPLLSLILLVILFTIADKQLSQGYFASVKNLRVVLNNSSIVAVAALGMTMVIIAGGIDLSVGTAVTLCATTLALGIKNELPIAGTISLTLLVGCLCGLLNGVLISGLRVVPFIVTLGTMQLFLGVGKYAAGESTVFPPRAAIPSWLLNLCSTRPPDVVWGFVPNIPWSVLLAAALALLVALILRGTVFGRYLFAIGSNEATARLCGVHVGWTKVAVYTLAGLFAGIAGIYHFSTIKIGNPVEGLGLELQVIAAVVIGGGSLSGGRGSVLGTLTGAAITAVIRSGCDQLDISNPVQDMLLGIIIIVAVATDRLRQQGDDS